MAALQIYDPRERALVTTADALLTAAATVMRPFQGRRSQPAAPERILLLRLERIGDLVMTLKGIADVSAAASTAQIDLVVGSWNLDLAKSIRGVSRVESLDAAWLARGTTGARIPALLRRAVSWRKRRYDLAINFEPDLRSNLLLAAAGAAWTAGYRSTGGGALLDVALEYDTTRHTTDNARRLVAAALGREIPTRDESLLEVPLSQRRLADSLLSGHRRPFVAMHVSGGRSVKQWDPDRFAEVARTLAASRGATIVLTGTVADRDLLVRVRNQVPPDRILDLSRETNLLTVAAVLERCDVMITGDTGPMHIAAAVGTPIVAVFGPSDPRRYAPRGMKDRVVRVDLPCAPCNRIRLPPARCTGHTPDCLALIAADRVLDAATSILDQCADTAAAARNDRR